MINRPSVFARGNLTRSMIVETVLPGLVLLALATTYALFYRSCRTIDVTTAEWMLGAAFRNRWTVIAVVLAATTSLLTWNVKWTDLAESIAIRWMVLPLILLMGWCFAFYDYNFYAGRDHIIDRLTLLVLSVLVCWRPAAIGWFLLQLGLILAHLNSPLMLSWTDKSTALDVLLLFHIYVTLLRTRLVAPVHFFWAAIGIISAHYVRPAIGKILLGWLFRNDLSCLMLAARFQNGWGIWLGEDQAALAASALSITSFAVMLATLLVELAPIFSLLSRRILNVVLLMTIAMHLGVFFSSGILFWKWIVLNTAVLVAVGRLGPDVKSMLFSRASGMCLMAALVVSWFTYTTAPVLAWLDSPVSVRYQIEVVGKSGSLYQVPPRNLAPFDLQFAQGRLGFLSETPVIVDCLGACTTLRELDICRRIEDLEDLSAARRGRSSAVDPQAAEALDDLLVAYVAAGWTREERNGWIAAIPDPPQHIWTYPIKPTEIPVWDWQESAQRIQIRRQTTRQHNFRGVRLENVLVRVIDL